MLKINNQKKVSSYCQRNQTTDLGNSIGNVDRNPQKYMLYFDKLQKKNHLVQKSNNKHPKQTKCLERHSR